MDKQHRSITNDLYGANVLLAPNGNPSNLSPQQYMLVRTPEFKEWFGDWERLAMAKVKDPAMDEVTLANLSKDVSKVVDQNGEPLLVYHLTREDFNIFEYRGYSQGFFFTPYKDSDFNYRGSKIITAFLNIKTLSELSNIPEGKWSVPMFENRFIEQAQLDKEYQSQKTWDDTIFKGYPNSDGIKFIRDNGEEIIVAFEPNQIKLADGTNTTFDSSNPDIRFVDGGEVNNEVLIDFVNQVEAYQSNHYGTYNRDNLVESYHKLPDSIKEKIKPISTKNLFRGSDGLSPKSAISFTKNEDYSKMFGVYSFPFEVVKENKGLIDTKRLSALLDKMRISNEIGDDEGEVIVIEPIFSQDINKNIEQFRFDNGGKVKKEREVKDLIVLHNINEYQIKEANKLGGLVTPSIAILESGNAFTDFGSISLIATKELIDPKNYDVKVFAGDVYSPSVPRKLWYVDKRLLEKVTNGLIKKSYLYENDISKSKGEIYDLVSSAIGDYSDLEKDISRLNFKDLIEQYDEKLRLVYIVEKGIKIKVPMKEKRHFLFHNVEFTLTDEQKKRFAPILREYTQESNEKGSSGISQENQSKVYDLFLEVLEGVKERIKSENSEEASEYLIDSLTQSFEKYVGTRYDWGGHSEYNLNKAVSGEQELDKEKFNQNIRKIFTKSVNEDYQKWLSDFMSQFQGSAYFLKGNEKVPYTLDNLVDATSNKIVGQEKNMTFGVNQAKSYATKRLNSIEDIKKNSDKLISKEEMNVIDENNKENFFKLAESLQYEYDSWGKFDSLGRALADYFKGSSVATALRKNDFKSPTNSQEYLFKEFADALKNSPVDYFEAKYQRAVSLKEFKYAIVPKTTSKEVIQILKDNGLIVKKYENNVERLEIINNIADKDKKIKFDDGGLVANLGGEIDMNSLSPESLKVLKSNYENSFGFYDFDWNTESERENFNQWLKDFEKRQFIKNLDKAIQHIESDIELKKKRKIVDLKRKEFEELIIPVLGKDVLIPKLSIFEAVALMSQYLTIEEVEKRFEEAKNIIDEDGSINESKITPHPFFQEDSINAVAFETFVQQNPDYIDVYNDWKKLFDEEIDLSFQDTYAFRYPSLEELEKLRLELLMLNRQKANKDVFNLGGKVQNDLDAYEEAMGESFFDYGGKAPIKKVYVSIRLRYDIEKVDGEYYYKYKEKPFLELMSGTLDGIKGVSSSSNNIAEWFTTRDALIVMNYQDFANINNIQVIDYENIDELMANDLFIFRRLYNNLNEYDESESQLSRVIIDSLRKIGKNISGELNLLLEVVDKQKAKEVYRIARFLNPLETSAFWKWIESNQIKIDSAISFTKAIIDFNKIDDNYLGYGFPNPTITIEDLLPSVENGIRYSSKIYESEQEIILLDRKLNIPKGSQLFFKNQTSESNRNDLIKSYKLDNRYKIYFVDNEDLERFRIKWMEKQEQVFKDRVYKGMMDLEEKKSKVLQDLLQKFLDNTYSQIEKIVEKDMLEYAQSKTFLNYDRDMEYQWYELPPIKKVLAEYEKIVRQEWEILESNKVKDLDLYKFASFQDQANQRIKEYFKENEQEIEDELYNYKTATNYYISLGLFKYDLLKSLYDYENLPQWFSYKDLSEMYLQKMGVDIYRYYDKKELKLVSQYEVGGEIN